VGSAVAQVARWSLRLLVIAAAAVGALYLVGQLWVVVLPALLALLLSTVLWPAARLLRRRLPASAAAIITLVGGLLPLAGLGTLMFTLVAAEAEELTDAVVTGLQDLQEWITRSPLDLGDQDPAGLIDRATDALQERAQEIAGWTLSGVGAAGSLMLTLVLTLVLTFFYLKDGPSFLPWLERWLPERSAHHATEVSNRTWNVLGGFIRAQSGVGLADAVGIGVGLAILGVPLALPLAVLTFIGAFIPVVGAVIAGLLAVLVALVSEGVTTALLVAALVLAVQQMESNLLQPMLMGRTLALHPALVILAVTAGGTISGVAGAFLAVPVLAVATALARYAKEQVDADHSSAAGENDAPDTIEEQGEADSSSTARENVAPDPVEA
jgi:putative heme transporter